MDSDRIFTKFPDLPVEIRLKIWSQACCIPRTIDVWTDFVRCEVNNTIFYCQQYLVELAPLPPPHILAVSREAREEALKSYSLEFLTSMHCTDEINASMPAKWYVNWECDMFVPRGYWNLVSFADFVSRGIKNGLQRVAIDVSGAFWRENLKDYVLGKDCWTLNGVREVVLYDAREDEMWKGSDYLDKFRKRHKDGPRILSFEQLEEPGEGVLHAERLLNRCWNRCEGVLDDDAGEEITAKKYLDDFDSTPEEYLLRPDLSLMKLIATKPTFSPFVMAPGWGAGVLD